MPIRFRCAYCNQLLGIARRKAGTVVRCPACSGQVVVPSLEEAGLAGKQPHTQPHQHPPPTGPFEGNEIDKMLEGAAGEQPSVIQPGPGVVLPSQKSPPHPAAAPAPSPSPVVPVPMPVPAPGPRPPGITLSPARATLLSVIVVIALAIAFGLGLFVGVALNLRRP